MARVGSWGQLTPEHRLTHATAIPAGPTVLRKQKWHSIPFPEAHLSR
jgi:hypothetical protein